MVTVSNYAVRTNSDEESFVVLILTGDLTMVQSQQTGRYYATVKSCSVVSTFTEEQAAIMVGKELPGTIIREECDPYDYVVEESGEVIELSHRWSYSPDETAIRPTKKEDALLTDSKQFSSNGAAAVA